MPQIRREMSWLSPRRRRTTGNLKTDVNGKTSGESMRASASTAGALVRPSASHRPLSHPVGEEASDGDLFYAYAKNEDNSSASHLLTFASASVMNEWWLLLQLHFPNTTRPESQQFVFVKDESLANVWRHPSFSHLRSKWMYTSSGRVGGAVQSLTPLQDMLGDLLGNSAHDVEELLPGLKDASRGVNSDDAKSDATRLEEYFTSMIEALQRNTDQAAELTAKIQAPADGGGKKNKRESAASATSNGSYFDMDALSTHLSQLNESLYQNSQHLEAVTRQHAEKEQDLRSTLENVTAKQNDDHLDMQRLSSHLDRIQSMLEDMIKDRRDSARGIGERPQPQIDFSPLTQRLEKVQDAIEQNSALIKTFLEQHEEVNETQPQLDITCLTEPLDRIHAAIEQQSEHTKALVGFASADGDGSESPAVFQDRNLAPLGEHLELIYNAIEEGNKHARESTRGDKFDLSPLTDHLEAIREANTTNTNAVKELIKQITENPTGELDLSPLIDRLDNIHSTLEHDAQSPGEDITSHLFQLQSLTEQTTTTIQTLQKKQSSSATKMHNAVTETSTQVRQLVEKTKEQEYRIEAQNSQLRELMSGQRELVEVVRQLAKGLASQNREACGHVVVPPPRKMNRKLVGFVYDAKD